MEIPHIPVLLHEVIEAFDNTKGIVVDCTLGYGGHSEALLKSNNDISIIGIDQDNTAIAFSSERLKEFDARFSFRKGRFSTVIEDIFQEKQPIMGVLADIGVSSLQLDALERGFGFESEELDMRMSQENPLSAYEVVNTYSQAGLEKILKEYGEVSAYKKVAQVIVQARLRKPIESAKELAQLVKPFGGGKKIHPATLVFQAIRIEVNDELGELERLLEACKTNAKSGLRVAIISFHSLEDRIVKNVFKEWSQNCICPVGVMRCECGNNHALGRVVTKKPIVADVKEIKINPRSRSAKLRIFEFE